MGVVKEPGQRERNDESEKEQIASIEAKLASVSGTARRSKRLEMQKDTDHPEYQGRNGEP
jgi:hypothetical protein